MRTRLAAAGAAFLVAGALSACAGSDGGAGAPAAASPGPTKTQLAARKLLAELDPRSCGCTAEARARERLADGRAKQRPDGVVLRPQP